MKAISLGLRTTASQTTATYDNCHPNNCHLGQLPPMTNAT